MHFMNPARGKHMGAPQAGEESSDVKQATGQHHPPQIHIHSHAKGHTVHIMHHDGRHEKHEHDHGDADGMAQHLHNHLGSEGQDHGGSSGQEMEDEYGNGPGL